MLERVDTQKLHLCRAWFCADRARAYSSLLDPDASALLFQLSVFSCIHFTNKSIPKTSSSMRVPNIHARSPPSKASGLYLTESATMNTIDSRRLKNYFKTPFERSNFWPIASSKSSEFLLCIHSIDQESQCLSLASFFVIKQTRLQIDRSIGSSSFKPWHSTILVNDEWEHFHTMHHCNYLNRAKGDDFAES
jgi:hypothetical protein